MFMYNIKNYEALTQKSKRKDYWHETEFENQSGKDALVYEKYIFIFSSS